MADMRKQFLAKTSAGGPIDLAKSWADETMSDIFDVGFSSFIFVVHARGSRVR